MKVFDIVSDLCEKRNISFNALERACDLANGTVSRLRKTMVSADKLKRIADFFGVSMEYLLTGEEAPEYYIDPESARIAQEIFDNPEMKILFDASRDISPDDLKFLAEMAKRMKATNPDG